VTAIPAALAEIPIKHSHRKFSGLTPCCLETAITCDDLAVGDNLHRTTAMPPLSSSATRSTVASMTAGATARTATAPISEEE